ncbi:hypothetical protein DFA_06943 [Cavenderia fasciculata]|uniref:Uncharacterized protein n=1 Tax=Cavenderia fasciculata TaxID=261658 RepID=F4PX38_CACFS|nr:uncharacterized protein DFA_06943 [Cavenderia fasciculata]EGG19841.1 hypothetical protein DFA_06943 [Cavenderia fasciculata]|eukprot:XP_004358187.1 hypothetical protein DFA_06943 [Cavenderia fasciculata]
MSGSQSVNTSIAVVAAALLYKRMMCEGDKPTKVGWLLVIVPFGNERKKSGWIHPKKKTIGSTVWFFQKRVKVQDKIETKGRYLLILLSLDGFNEWVIKVDFDDDDDDDESDYYLNNQKKKKIYYN